jgi:alkaline phosphatase
MYKNLIAIIAILIFAGCSATAPNTPSEKKPKNIILLIGDGMGVTQITAGMYANGNKLNLEKFKVLGLHKTHPAHKNNLITDSAAGATAFACGVKTNNGAIGVDENENPVKTILEMAEEKNLATGLVSTSSITHATPASFIAHQRKRKMMQEIAADFLKTEIDFFVGGGKKHFELREDDRNITEELKTKGYYMSDFIQEELADVQIPEGQNFGYFTANAEPLTKEQDRDYLTPATEMAINFLDNHTKNGFFLMVEGSQIDWGGHANNSDYIVTEMIDFDNMVAKALDFAEKDGNTLVIVTADHETGGYSIIKGSTPDTLVTKFTTDYHTADMIPVFAYGPGAEAFGGIYENTAIFDKMKAAFGF